MKFIEWSDLVCGIYGGFSAFSQFWPTVCLYISFTASILILVSAKQSLPPVSEYSPPANEHNRLSLDFQEPPLYKTE